MIHSRIYEHSTKIGVSEQRRAQAFDVLISSEALEIFYDHIVALAKILDDAGQFIGSLRTLKDVDPNGQNIVTLEEEIRGRRAQFLASLNQMSALRPMPKFPTERELYEAVNLRIATNSAIVSSWYEQPWTMPQLPTQGAWIHSAPDPAPQTPPQTPAADLPPKE